MHAVYIEGMSRIDQRTDEPLIVFDPWIGYVAPLLERVDDTALVFATTADGSRTLTKQLFPSHSSPRRACMADVLRALALAGPSA